MVVLPSSCRSAGGGSVRTLMVENDLAGGQITKLKLVKRQMYGRAKLDLLRARLVPSAWNDPAPNLIQSQCSTPNNSKEGRRNGHLACRASSTRRATGAGRPSGMKR